MYSLKESHETLQPPRKFASEKQVEMLGGKSIPQGVLNFLYHADKLSLEKAGEILLAEAKLRLENHEIMWFFYQYIETLFNYYQDPRLKFSSFRFDERMFKSHLDPWLNQVLNKKDQYLPLIISNMLKGDIASKCLYESLYTRLDKKDLILDSYKQELVEVRKHCINEAHDYVSCESALTAQYWLNSTEGHDVLCNGLIIHVPQFELLLDHPC